MSQSPWGSNKWGEQAWGDNGIDVQVGSDAWGQGAFGEFAWGDGNALNTISLAQGNAIATISIQSTVTGEELVTTTNTVTVQANADVSLTALSTIQTTLGDEILSGNVNVFPDSLVTTTNVNSASITADGNVSENLIGEVTLQTTTDSVSIEIAVGPIVTQPQTLSLGLGNEVAFTDVDIALSGEALTTTTNTVSIDLNTPVDLTGELLNSTTDTVSVTGSAITGVLTGQSMSISEGNADLVSIAEVTGQGLTTTTNTVTITGNAIVSPTGINITATTGNEKVVTWSKVVPGVSNSWTEINTSAANTWVRVDTAA